MPLRPKGYRPWRALSHLEVVLVPKHAPLNVAHDLVPPRVGLGKESVGGPKVKVWVGPQSLFGSIRVY